MNYKDITSHQEARRLLGRDPGQKVTTDQAIVDVFDAFNKLTGFSPDFNNPYQKKWRPWFYVDASGLRFDDSYCDVSYSYSRVGSRLCNYVSSEEEANFIGRTFEYLFKAHYFSRPDMHFDVKSEEKPSGFFWHAVHNLVAHPLLVTRARWADRFHEWTAKRM